MRTNRKEIYFTREEKEFLKKAMQYTGLDETNCIRLLIRLGWHFLTGAPDAVASDMHLRMVKPKNTNVTGGIKNNHN